MNITYKRSGYVFGEDGITDGIILEVSITREEADELLSSYDQSSALSPNDTISRDIARFVLNSIIDL